MDTKPTIFEFSSYKFEPEKKRIFFNYKQKFKGKELINFTETLVLPEAPDLTGLPKGLVDKILQGVHLILGISYYKFYCATKVKLNYSLSKKESDFWNIIYKKGLGEFYYRNKLDPRISPKFYYSKKAKINSYCLNKNNKCLIAVSGGKDSIVAAELLKEQGIDIAAIFTEAQRGSDVVDKVIDILGVKSLKFRRILDNKALQKHKYDGHVPVSAMFAFLGILYAVLYRYSYCVMANEYSSNFGNVKHKGQIINHQWSKSSEFENMFRDYVDSLISPDVRCFSLMRPFYELRIAKYFSEYKKYFPYFSSCNKNFKLIGEKRTGLWCGQCPKCIFTFILLSAFLTKEELLNIFKKNLYHEEKLLSLFKDILGLGKMKPFDCVGTFEESKAAFYLGSKKFRSDFMVKALLPKIKIKRPKGYPEIKELFSAKQAGNIPDNFKFLGMKSVLLLGYGKEGKVSQRYIKKNFPKLKIGITDQSLSKNYLKQQENYDIAIKTSGISKNLVKIQYTTATNIFLSKINQLGNQTIGVTGSKGKSTTASLIYAILKEAGKNVSILGNIGNPMLGALMSQIKKDEIFVIEFSSYQLDDVAFSPNIAVVTNLFPEHMDYHIGLESYYQAKKNIIKFQSDKDIFVYNPKNRKIRSWLREVKGKAVPFANKIPSQDSEIPLLGEHNKENIKAAVAVARELNVADEIIKRAIKRFKALPHRLEFVGKFKSIKFYDDAISTTPESTIEAIKSLQEIDTIFLGGEDRGYNFSQLEKVIKKYKIKNAALFPNSSKRIKIKGLNIIRTKSMEVAVRFAYKYTEPGKICLLSCASPSYSLWKNFEEKGNQFQSIVKKLGR